MKYIIYNLLFICSLIVLNSCLKDNSTLESIELNTFYVDTVGVQTTFEIQQSIEDLSIVPNIVYSGTDELTYRWIVYNASNTFIDEAGTEKNLSIRVSRPAGNYTAELQVTEPSTGIKTMMRYTIVVNPPLPYGWLVLHEAETPGHSDVSLIRTSEIIKSLQQDTVMRDIYSASNGTAMPGNPIALVSNTNIGLMFTSTNAGLLNLPDYKKLFDYNQLFLGAPPTPKIEGILRMSDFSNFLVNDGAAYLQSSNQFVTKISVGDDKGYRAAPWGLPYILGDGAFYDSLNRRFIQLGRQSGGVGMPVQPATSPTPLFQMDNIGKDILFADQGFGSFALYAFFEDVDKQNRWLYGFNLIMSPQTLCMINISHLPEISSARHFQLGTTGNMALYATDQRIYNFAYAAGSNSATPGSLGFTAPAGEVITKMNLFKVAGNGFTSAESKSNRILFVATWNETSKNGKVYLLGVDPTSGLLVSTPLKSFEGFGKIKDMVLKPQ